MSKYVNPSKKILLLGVTPEIRESLAELKGNVTCIDINKEMISAMNSILKVKNPHEEILNENWLDNSLPDNSFDIVLMINVLHHVDYRDRTKLLKEVKRVLKYKGISLIFEHNPFNPLVWYRFYYVSKIDKRCQVVSS